MMNMLRWIVVVQVLLLGAVAAVSGAEADRPGHWAFKAPVRPRLPNVADAAWPAVAIDHFILAELERMGLRPAPPADRYALVRRIYLDLTGLPPSPAEVDRFIADEAPGAYERLVDQLLASPRFGEHWAAMWLDLARYADTKGHGTDPRRTMWPYRDWVIEALNADMPYDQFTIEQIAGDLIQEPGLTPDSWLLTPDAPLLATAFHRNTMSNDEGGANDDEEYRIAAVKDRVETTMQVWLGLTASCASCHDHKYDPLTQRDYYRLYAIFNQTADADRLDSLPVARFPTRRMAAENAPILRQIEALDVQLADREAELAAAQAEWEASALEADPWVTLAPHELTSESGIPLTVLNDGSILAGGDPTLTDVYTFVTRTDLSGIRAVRLDVMPDPSLPLSGPGRNVLSPSATVSELILEAGGADDADGLRPVKLVNPRASNTGPLAARAVVDGKENTGWSTGRPFGTQQWIVCGTAEPVGEGEMVTLRLRIVQHGGGGSQVGRFRLSVTSDPDAGLESVIPPQVRAALERPPSQRTPTQLAVLRSHYRSIAPQLAAWRKQREALTSRLVRGPEVEIMQELAPEDRRATHLHVRGDFRVLGEPVTAGVPAFLLAPAIAKPADELNRLDLARWLVDVTGSGVGPLASRVAVNRYWARLFGTGLVETEEDFGTQGSAPSHPQLLDWLATEYVRTGWSMKSIMRTIVLSAAYRQAPASTPRKSDLDPHNRLLSRGPWVRMSAEMIRDHAMAVSGLLVGTIGGEPVMPFLPAGVWNIQSFSPPWSTSAGGDRYRRGVYTFVQRSVPYPSMIAFDAPTRETCTLRRSRTQTPLQVLVTLNDPVFVEAAQAMARRIVNEGGADTRSRIEYALRLATVRPPDAQAVDALAGLYERRRAAFEQDHSAAEQLAGKPPTAAPPHVDAAQLAAWTIVCNVILNMDVSQVKR